MCAIMRGKKTSYLAAATVCLISVGTHAMDLDRLQRRIAEGDGVDNVVPMIGAVPVQVQGETYALGETYDPRKVLSEIARYTYIYLKSRCFHLTTCIDFTMNLQP